MKSIRSNRALNKRDSFFRSDIFRKPIIGRGKGRTELSKVSKSRAEAHQIRRITTWSLVILALVGLSAYVATLILV